VNLVEEEIRRFQDKLSAEGTRAAMYDGQYSAEWYRFAHLLSVMDAAMEAASLMSDTRRQVIRHVLASAPNEGDAIQRLLDHNAKLLEIERSCNPALTWPRTSRIDGGWGVTRPW
jgi:hypothetical protein